MPSRSRLWGPYSGSCASSSSGTLRTRSSRCHLQLLRVDGAAAVGVKEVECLFDLLLLLLSEFLLFLPALIESAERHSRKTTWLQGGVALTSVDGKAINSRRCVQ